MNVVGMEEGEDTVVVVVVLDMEDLDEKKVGYPGLLVTLGDLLFHVICRIQISISQTPKKVGNMSSVFTVGVAFVIVE